MISLNNAIRSLRGNGNFTIINIVGLAFGITCAILIIMHVYKESSYNSAIPENERVFQLVQKSPESPLGNTSISYALTPLLAKNYPEIEYFARTENFSWYSNCIVTYQPKEESKRVSFNEPSFYLADRDLFQIIPYPFLEGSKESALLEPNSIVLSKKTAEKYFGDQPALGKTLILNDEHSFIVSGVVDIPEYVTFKFSMIAPITTLRSEEKLAGWDSNGEPYFKLRKNVDHEDFNNKVARFYATYRPESVRNPEQLTLSFLPISARRLYYNKNPLYLLIFIGVVVMVVSILNYINMSTSLVQKRKSKIALKKISGASKREIGWEFMKETALISFLAILFGVFLAIIGIPVFKNLTGSDVEPFIRNNIGLFMIGSFLLWALVTLLSGFYPALVLSGVRPLVLFRKEGRTKSGVTSKSILITFQFVISIILVILTVMINRQYRYMAGLPLGFDNELIMQIPYTEKLKSNYLNLKDELNEIPSVKEVCAASAMPAGIPNHSGVTWTDDKGEKHQESFGFAIVSDGYTQTFNMHLVEGNEFISEKPEELKGVIINETAAKILGYKDPLGHQIHFWGKENMIIGVVKDFQNNYIFNTVKPMVMSAHPDNQHFTKYLYISLLPGDINQTVEAIEKTILNVSPEFPYEYSFTSAEVEGYINEIKQIESTFQFASIISILLAIIGLVALTFHATQSRIKEIGVRKVNGARNLEIINLLNNAYLRYVVLAFIIACPIAWKIINLLLQGIGNKATIVWWIFAMAGLFVLSIALLTVSWQSWKAANKNPVEALRYE